MSTHRQWLAQAKKCDAEMQRMADLDAREDECWRMFGVEVFYVHDERVVEVERPFGCEIWRASTHAPSWCE